MFIGGQVDSPLKVQVRYLGTHDHAHDRGDQALQLCADSHSIY